jgi:hypothetical protein
MAELPKDAIPMVEFGFSIERRKTMKRLLFLLLLGLMFIPAQVFCKEKGSHVIIREGYSVPNGKLLFIDDITIQCVTWPTDPNQTEGFKSPRMSALLLVKTPDVSKCREPLNDDVCPDQAFSIGTGTSEETLYGFGTDCLYGPNSCAVESLVGRQTALIAHEGAVLEASCRWGYPPATDGPDLYLTSRIVTGIGRLVKAPNRRTP